MKTAGVIMRCRYAPSWKMRLAGGMILWGVLVSAGCQPPTPTGTDKVDGTTGVNPDDFPDTPVQGEPNDSFEQALFVVLGADGTTRIEGSLPTEQDVDVYNLGPARIGDRIRVDVVAETPGLDAAFAVFDDEGRILFENDDRNLDLQQLDPYFNSDVRRETTATYLAITSSPLGPSTGDYHANITIQSGDPVEGQRQTVLLDFSGGSVTIPGDRTYTVDAFTTDDISPAYVGFTEDVIAGIVATVRENYDGLQLDLLIEPGDGVPAGSDFSRVLFGGFSRTAFGLAESVDTMNLDRCDDAIIFIETFRPSNFGRVLTSEELGTAIGNVASHEIGHLLGLNHVSDTTDLMDSTGSPLTFAVDQEFLNSPLEESIFPIGFQDAWLLLTELLGFE